MPQSEGRLGTVEAVVLLCVHTLTRVIIKHENVISFLEVICIVMKDHSNLLNVAASEELEAKGR